MVFFLHFSVSFSVSASSASAMFAFQFFFSSFFSLSARLVRFVGSPLAGRSCLRLQGCVYPVHGRSRSDPLARDRRTVPATSWLPSGASGGRRAAHGQAQDTVLGFRVAGIRCLRSSLRRWPAGPTGRQRECERRREHGCNRRTIGR